MRPALSCTLLAAMLAGCAPTETAEARRCPDWTRPPGFDWRNRPSSNFGCADATNFHAMLDRPTDAEAGRALGPSLSDHDVLAVQRYRRDEVRRARSEGSGKAAAPGIPQLGQSGGDR